MPGLATAVFSKPARIGAVARVTLTQLVRMKLFLVPAAFAVLVLALQFIPYQESIGIEFQGVAQLELLKDVALGCMQVFISSSLNFVQFASYPIAVRTSIHTTDS